MSLESQTRPYDQKQLALLNANKGIRYLLNQKKLDYDQALVQLTKDDRIKQLQRELIKLQTWVIKNKQRVIVIFEGRDAAGKGGAIRRIVRYLNPRYFKVIALPKPSTEELGQWYFQRYIQVLPNQGQICFFDRSWYNRAIVEPVNGFCTQDQYKKFMNHVNEFESMLVEDNIHLIKFYISISKAEQAKRFKEISNNPLKKWKMSPVDKKAQELWDVYTAYKKKMFKRTNTDFAPWTIIKANNRQDARIAAMEHILQVIPYK